MIGRVSTLTLENGLPQTSVLSLLLFKVYTNDVLPISAHKFIYADDMVPATQHQTLEDGNNQLTQDLEALYQ